MAPYALRHATDIARHATNAAWHAVCTLVVTVPETLVAWQTRSEVRHAMGALDDRLLSDMGITRADALREAAKPFWKA